ncbi:hypothetical protein [Halocatena marina]|uniref:Uncharacterized protein n=1 Tax=Halocatena marina TaxID=2934937 RepID=A0ABD5YU11_9EURY|nr:hypothetical protein [Halocatena marina]
MQRTTLCHIFLVLVVGMAGCNAVDTLDDPFQADNSSTATLTPAPVPTDTAASRLAPGLTRYSMDSQVLAHAHNTTLQNTSFTMKETRTATYPNGTVFSEQITTVRVGSEGNFSNVINRTVLPRSGPLQASTTVRYYEIWSGDTPGSITTTYANNTTTYSNLTSRPEGALFPISGTNSITRADTIRRLFEWTDMKAVNTTARNGTTRYHVTTSVVRMPRGPPGVNLQGDQPSVRGFWSASVSS